MSRRDDQKRILKKLKESRISERINKLRSEFSKLRNAAHENLPPNALRSLFIRFESIVPRPTSSALLAHSGIGDAFSNLPIPPQLVPELTQPLFNQRLFPFNQQETLKQEMLAAVQDEIDAVDKGLDMVETAMENENLDHTLQALTRCTNACQKLTTALTED